MRFRYVAYNLKQGVTEGMLDATDQPAALAEVSSWGYRPLSVVPASGVAGISEKLGLQSGVPNGDIVHLTRQLATMVGSGGNLLRSLQILQNEAKNKSLSRILRAIYNDLDNGVSLSSALKEHPKVFNDLYVSMVEVGEYTGRLAPALEEVADILHQEHEAKQKAMQAMMYPLAIVALSMVTLVVLLMVAMPPMLKIFEQTESEVPMMTRVTIGLVTGITANFREISVALALLMIGFVAFRSHPAGRYCIDSAMAGSPVLGPFVIAGEMSRFARTLATLLDAGVPLSDGLRLAMKGCKNQVVLRAFEDSEASLLSGHSLGEPLRQHKIIPSMFVELILIGEESNSVAKTMRDAGLTYQQQLETRLDNILGLIEPASTVAVGGIVGVIAFSMFLPIYSGLNTVG